MRVEWIVEGISGDWQQGHHCPLASHRYRVILPATAMRQGGLSTEFSSPAAWTWAEARTRADAFVVGKLLPGADLARFQAVSARLLEQVRLAVTDGCTVLADFNDDHFEHPVLGGHWKGLARVASACVAGSPRMAERVQVFTDRPVTVIADPVSSPFEKARVFQGGSPASGWLGRLMRPAAGGGQRLKLVWYGHPSNWGAVPAWCESLAAFAEQPMMLWLVTQPEAGIAAFVERFNERHQPRMILALLPWEESSQWDVVCDADVVLIPSSPADPTKAVKSANRLTDALHAGRFVIASPVPAYLPYAAFTALVESPNDALKAYLSDPAAALEKIQGGQAMVAATAGPEAIARTWEQALRAPYPPLSASNTSSVVPPAPLPAPSAAPVRLNLGCGDKILEGYVNVDVVESRAGRRPDVLSDLRDLSCFATGFADEVMAIHVVEHFWRWEIEAVLREWVRVLKPGGELVIECPNLEAACAEFLRDPDRFSGPGPEGQMSMWVFYGDPAWRDPLMVHRWGYTPNSLKKLLESVGLTDVAQRPACFKKREPRDMRVVGRKPF